MIKTTLAAVAAVSITAFAGAASAATFSIKDTDETSFLYTLSDAGNYNPSGAEAQSLDNSEVTVFNSSTNGGSTGGGLYIDGNAEVTVTFLGKEAGFTNRFVELESDGVKQKIFNTDSLLTSFSYIQNGPEFVNFKFQGPLGKIVNGGNSQRTTLDLAMQLFDDGKGAYLFFGDGGGGNDFDLDDMVMRLDISAVPLPASSLLLIAGIGGLAAMKRRKS